MSTARTPTPDAPDGLRARKKAQRRDALIDASHALVLERGLDAVTVEMICDAVGVSPRTFFNYFESKTDAVLGVQPWALDPAVDAEFAAGGPSGHQLTDCAAVVASILTDSPLDHARMATVMELARREPGLVVRQMAWLEEHRSAVEALVARRTGSVRPGPREATTAAFIMFLTRSACLHWAAAEHTDHPVSFLPAAIADVRALTTDA